MHLFGFDMDLPPEFETDFKHYFDNGTLAVKKGSDAVKLAQHDYAMQARENHQLSPHPTCQLRPVAYKSLAELILTRGLRQKGEGLNRGT